MQGALDAALELAGQKPELAPRVLAALRPEFALRMLNEVRIEEAFLVGSTSEPGPDCARLLEPVEPHVPFTKPWLDVPAALLHAAGRPARSSRPGTT